jgi:DNA mismatch endonuclease, patch repair protein
MSMIRARDTSPEIEVRRGLREAGFRGYSTRTSLTGKPDIVFPRARLAVFVDGCFWHRCPIDYHPPRTRKQFWARKIARNVARDKAVCKELEREGWTVLRVWEHQVRESPESVIALISDLARTER